MIKFLQSFSTSWRKTLFAKWRKLIKPNADFASPEICYIWDVSPNRSEVVRKYRENTAVVCKDFGVKLIIWDISAKSWTKQ